ncbi:MAG: gfo/Idh/MocA family oxidoreductase [Chloroflexi bacterium HGW-Chloroflexi-10]|nr:MAG: gfo/Idh/MocA family oxidoreductase [Chloroflexi bacterium HGW-Chloroflexi-10]
MNPLRTAILGCGQFAHRHAQILASLPHQAKMVAFSDHTEDNGRRFAQQYTQGQGAVYFSHTELFQKENLDLVIICLPPFAHSDEVELAASKGVHILIEKPIALTSELAWKMVRSTEQAGIKTQVGFMFRFGEAVESLKQQIDSGEAGMLGLMSARYFCNALHAKWWREKDKSGGQVVEQAIHMFDLLRYFGGEPLSVYSQQKNLFHRNVERYSIEDVSATIVNFQQGGLGVVYATNNAIPGKWINDYRVVTQNITAEFKNANQATLVRTDTVEPVETIVDSERDFRLEQTLDLIRAIRENRPTRTPMREGAKSLDLVLAAAQSAQEQHEIKLC